MLRYLKEKESVSIMLKGTQKRMVVLRTADSSLFETAYFILRDAPTSDPPTPQHSMLEEANRILESNLTARTASAAKKAARARRRRSFLFFLLGAISGAAVCLLAALLLYW